MFIYVGNEQIGYSPPFGPTTTFHAAVDGYNEEPFEKVYSGTRHRRSYNVGCTPDSSETRRIMTAATEYWNATVTTLLNVTYFASELAMENFYVTTNHGDQPENTGVGIVFADASVNKLSYTIRLQADSEPPPTGKPYILDESELSAKVTGLNRRKTG